MLMTLDPAPAEAVAVALDPHFDDHGYRYGHDDCDNGVRDNFTSYSIIYLSAYRRAESPHR